MAKPQAKIKRAVNDELGYAKLRVPSGHPFFPFLYQLAIAPWNSQCGVRTNFDG